MADSTFCTVTAKICKNNYNKISKKKKSQHRLENLMTALRPKVYIIDSCSFKNLVQELTGNGTASFVQGVSDSSCSSSSSLPFLVASPPPPPVVIDVEDGGRAVVNEEEMDRFWNQLYTWSVSHSESAVN